MKGPWRMLALLVAVGVVAGASIAIAAPSGTSSSSKSKSGSASGNRVFREHHGPGPREDLSALAGKLGVSTTELRNALDAVRNDIKPPARRTQPPTRQQMQQSCTKFTDALAKELGKTGDEVRSAMKAVAKDRLAAAVKAGRLTQDQADAIQKRIDSSDCAPLGPGGPGPGPHGCGGPGHGPGDGDGDGPGHGFGPPPGADNDSSGTPGSSAPSVAPAAPQTFSY